MHSFILWFYRAQITQTKILSKCLAEYTEFEFKMTIRTNKFSDYRAITSSIVNTKGYTFLINVILGISGPM
jgi:hypothetical protein